MNSFWSFVSLFFWSFAFVAYLFALFAIIGDLFRDDKLNGWWKALWVIFLLFVPFLTALVYLIARGKGMAERRAADFNRVRASEDDYIRTVASTSPAEDIARAKQLLDDGVISANEFDALKNKALGNKF